MPRRWLRTTFCRMTSDVVADRVCCSRRMDFAQTLSYLDLDLALVARMCPTSVRAMPFCRDIMLEGIGSIKQTSNLGDNG